MTEPTHADILGDLRGLLYDWKSERLVNSASSFIQYANKVEKKIARCNKNGFSEILEGIDFYNEWGTSDHKQLLKFIDGLQSLWNWYEKLSDRDATSYDKSNDKRTLQLCDGCVFTLESRNRLRCEHPQERVVDLWKTDTVNGFVTVLVGGPLNREFCTLIPTQDQEVSEKAVQTLLDLFHQNTNNN